MEVYCARCRRWDPHHQASSGTLCETCGAGLLQRKGPPPSPRTHLGALLKAIGSLSGVLLILLYTVMDALPSWRVQAMGAALIYVAAIKLAWRAMATEKGVIRFPELDPRGILRDAPLLAVVAYVALFVWLPVNMAQVAVSPDLAGYAPTIPTLEAEELEARAQELMWRQGDQAAGHNAAADRDDEDAEDAPQATAAQRQDQEKRLAAARVQVQKTFVEDVAAAKAARKKLVPVRVALVVLSIILALYAAMALVLFLRSNSGMAMLGVGSALHIMKMDPAGYFTLSAAVMGINLVAFVSGLPVLHKHLALAIPLGAVKGVATLLAYGLCGLYVRQHARALQVACDEDDWEPATVLVPQAPPAAAQARAPAPHQPAPPPASAPTAAPTGFHVFPCHLAGRSGAQFQVMSSTGQAMALQPSQVRLVGAGLVTLERTVLLTDVVLHGPGPVLTVLRFNSDTMALDSAFPGLTPPQAHAAWMGELLSAGAQAWPNAAALTTGAFSAFPSETALEHALYQGLPKV